MLGIPVIVKDNVNTTGMPTTAGSLALKGSTPPDAYIVKRLKAQGALIIGKADLSGWTNYRGSGSSSSPSAISRFPDITVPADYSSGIPASVAFSGTRWGEPKLLSLAYSWEQATQARRRPRFLDTAPRP